jgi:hypothetical protein
MNRFVSIGLQRRDEALPRLYLNSELRSLPPDWLADLDTVRG